MAFLLLQALVVIHDDDDMGVLQSLGRECAELTTILATEVLSGPRASKKDIIARVVSGSASLVHFLVHGTSRGEVDGRLFFFSPLSFLMILLLLPLCSYYCYLYSSIMPSALHTHTHTHTHTKPTP